MIHQYPFKTSTKKQKEPTKAVNVPLSRVKEVLELLIAPKQSPVVDNQKTPRLLKIKPSTTNELPLFTSNVSAGVPSPADDEVENGIDLNTYLLNNPQKSFAVRATGDSMLGEGINQGDLLIVDCDITPKSGRIVVAAVDGELTVKTLFKNKDNKLYLMPANPEYKPIEITENQSFTIIGVVTNVIHKL